MLAEEWNLIPYFYFIMDNIRKIIDKEIVGFRWSRLALDRDGSHKQGGLCPAG